MILTLRIETSRTDADEVFGILRGVAHRVRAGGVSVMEPSSTLVSDLEGREVGTLDIEIPARDPLLDAEPPVPMISTKQRALMNLLLKTLRCSIHAPVELRRRATKDEERDGKIAWVSALIERPIGSTNALTMHEAGMVIDRLLFLTGNSDLTDARPLAKV